MIPRYTTEEMNTIWSDANRFRVWFEVEIAACEAWEKQGRLPEGVTVRLSKKAEEISWGGLADRVAVIEETTRHDVIAFLSALEEVLGEESRHIHFGMTSSDVVDTSFAYLLVQSGRQLECRLAGVFNRMRDQAEKHRHTICLGRTHGQAAEPTTWGLKLLTYVSELDRNRLRLSRAIDEIAVGKLSGAVGNFGNIDPAIEAHVMERLGLSPESISTQIVPRDRHAMFFSALAVIAGTIERFSVEIRHLMRSEVSEVFEPFGKGQRGSSAMPHKKNPILTENLTGLCRLVRNYAGAAFENQALWHERDISHSSVERVIAPDATTALDFALQRMSRVVEGMTADEGMMASHVEATGGLIHSESVLLSLVEQGVLRQEAYGWVQKAAMDARSGQGSFLSNLKDHPEVSSRVSAEKLDALFDPTHHLRHADALFDRVNAEIDKTSAQVAAK
jgi:adenylosuccinate lyase